MNGGQLILPRFCLLKDLHCGKAIFNTLMKDYVINNLFFKKNRGAGNNPTCSYYEPSSLNTKMKQLFAELKATIKITWKYEKDFSFDGGLAAVIKKMFSKIKVITPVRDFTFLW